MKPTTSPPLVSARPVSASRTAARLVALARTWGVAALHALLQSLPLLWIRGLG
jgi:hypothetical protein